MRTLILVISLFLASGVARAQHWKVLQPVPVKLSFPVVEVLNGNIHVVGGGATGGATDIHLRYSPSTDTWDTLAPVPYLAQQPGGAVVNGKLHYFGGGYPNSGSRLDDHYSYDPTTNKWTQEADVPIPRVIHKTAVLGDSIYVMSGQPDKLRVDVYNTQTKKWSKKSNLPDANFWYSGIVEHDSNIYRFGGGGSGAPTDAAHVYDPSKDRWSSIARLPEKTHAPDAAVLGDSIFVGGGYDLAIYRSRVWIYDIKANSYSKGPWFNDPSAYHNMVTVDNCIYAVGGHNTSNPDDVGVSLIRFCRGDKFSSTGEPLTERKQLEVFFDGDLVHVDWRRNIPETNEIKLTLIDITGKEVHTHIVNTSTKAMSGFRVSQTGISPGVYTIRAVHGNHMVTKKIQVTSD